MKTNLGKSVLSILHDLDKMISYNDEIYKNAESEHREAVARETSTMKQIRARIESEIGFGINVVETLEISGRFPNLFREQMANGIRATITVLSPHASAQFYEYGNGVFSFVYGSRSLAKRFAAEFGLTVLKA